MAVKTITVRDLRQRWPDAEGLLKAEGELLITRDGEPVAKLVRFVTQRTSRRPFDPSEHRRWQQQVFGKAKVVRWVDAALAKERADRKLKAGD